MAAIMTQCLIYVLVDVICMVWDLQWPRERALGWIPLLKLPNSLMTMDKLLNFLVHCLFIILRHFYHPELLWRFNKMKLITMKNFILMLPHGGDSGTLGCSPHLSHGVREDLSVWWVWVKNLSSAPSFPFSGAKSTSPVVDQGLRGQVCQFRGKEYISKPPGCRSQTTISDQLSQ